MSLFGDLLKGANPLQPIFGAVETLIDRLVPDKNLAAKEKAAFEEATRADVAKAMQDQRDINKIEARHPSLFVAGARPALLWVCVASIACYFIPTFLVGMALWVWACFQAGALVPRPELGIGDVLALIGCLLGVSIPRTVEKLAGVATHRTK